MQNRDWMKAADACRELMITRRQLVALIDQKRLTAHVIKGKKKSIIHLDRAEVMAMAQEAMRPAAR